MNALTLTQPWGSLMALGLKKIETRSWYTSYRGDLVIHAAKGYPRDARDYADVLVRRGVLPTRDLPLGAALCLVRLEECLETRGLIGLSDDELEYGNYAYGRFGWCTTDLRALVEPVPCRGKLGIWDVGRWNDADVERQILAQLARP